MNRLGLHTTNEIIDLETAVVERMNETGETKAQACRALAAIHRQKAAEARQKADELEAAELERWKHMKGAQ